MELSPVERGSRLAVGAVNVAYFILERARGGAFAHNVEGSEGLTRELQQASITYYPALEAEHPGGLPELRKVS